MADQLNTHQSESLVCLVAERCGITDHLGEKGESGVLKSLATRATFLSDRTHRIQFVYTPKHTSWLNQIEIWFSLLVRCALKRGTFPSLEERLLGFIDDDNQTAKRFQRTYKGRPLMI